MFDCLIEAVSSYPKFNEGFPLGANLNEVVLICSNLIEVAKIYPNFL